MALVRITRLATNVAVKLVLKESIARVSSVVVVLVVPAHACVVESYIYSSY